MSSPFPGMDPFLEGEMFQEFHDTLANEIRAQLLPHVKPKYVALLAKRYSFEHPILNITTTIYPDVHVAKQTRVAYVAGRDIETPTVELENPLPEPMPYLAVEIRDVAERRLVTAIEIFSPVNKHGKGAREYNEKRLEILETETHLLEIDLLRQGERIALVGELPRAPYFVFLSRWTRRPKTEIYPIQLRARLPVVPVPLLPPDPDVPLDLQAALDACFDLVGYERLLDYASPLADLGADDAAWVKETLQKTIQKS
ncbi:MAG: DUF4058 family protein [Chloroflexota bacterium]|nr:DUF4058 family protein [Chloroflexota bacterium]